MTASELAFDPDSIIYWVRGLFFVGMVVVFALGFQSGQRYG